MYETSSFKISQRWKVIIRQIKLSEFRDSKNFNKFTIPNLLFVFCIHFTYAWVRQGILFGIFHNQTLEIQDLENILSSFHYGSNCSIRYGIGIFFGGLCLDIGLIIIIFKRIEYFFLILYFLCFQWKKNVHIWSTRLIGTFLIRIIPIYSIDYRTFSLLGFFGRDTELSQRISQYCYNYPIVQEQRLPILFEGRYVMGRDIYGYSIPEITREPWIVSQLVVEASRDPIDETNIVGQTTQRVEDIYFGVLEETILNWIMIRTREKKETQLIDVPVITRSSVRINLNSDVTPKDTSPRFTSPGVQVYIYRFDQCIRINKRIEKKDSLQSFSLSLRDVGKVPEGLFSLSINYSFQRSFVGSVGMIDSKYDIEYAQIIEFFRIHNARISILHRRPILRYIDLLLITRLSVKRFSKNISTRQQQHRLYVAQSMIFDYVIKCRLYSKTEKNMLITSQSQKYRSTYNPIPYRNRQRKFYSYFFSNSRSRINNNFIQQYVGNLQLIHRFFAISWTSDENFAPFSIQRRKQVFIRRKMSLDQIDIEKGKNIFEHEEMGQTFILNIEIEKEQIFRIFTFLDVKKQIKSNWVINSKKRRYSTYYV